ncbi:hypothetical protein P8452_06456 [Trifolium repens]|nr:hypothetical protein P8452_06456 [Trifolium repens]
MAKEHRHISNGLRSLHHNRLFVLEGMEPEDEVTFFIVISGNFTKFQFRSMNCFTALILRSEPKAYMIRDGAQKFTSDSTSVSTMSTTASPSTRVGATNSMANPLARFRLPLNTSTQSFGEVSRSGAALVPSHLGLGFRPVKLHQ